MPDITEADFKAWRNDRVTRWIFEAIEQSIAHHRAEYDRQCWEFGNVDQRQLRDLRVRFEERRALIDTEFESWESWHEREDDGEG